MGVLRLFYRKDIMGLLPHRKSSLMVDQIVYNLAMPERITGLKAINERTFGLAGHFPKNPLYPGYCQVECVNLCAAVLGKVIFPAEKGIPVIREHKKIKYLYPVKPGDFLEITVDFLGKEGKFLLFSGEIKNQKMKKTLVVSLLKGIAVGSFGD